MTRSRRRQVPALFAAIAAASLVLAACGQPPAAPPPVVVEGQVVAETSMYSVSFHSDQICAPAGSDVLVEVDTDASQITQVLIYDPAGPPPTADSSALVQNPGHLVQPAPAPCFKVLIAISSFVAYPAGTTLDYRIVAPGSAPPAVSPLGRSLSTSAGEFNGADLSPQICAPIGTPVTVAYTGNEATVSADLYYHGSSVGPQPPGTTDPSGSFSFTTTDPCFSVLVVVGSLPPTATTLNYTVTW